MSELSNCCGAETIPLKGYPPTCSKCGQEQLASPPAVGDVREKIAGTIRSFNFLKWECMLLDRWIFSLFTNERHQQSYLILADSILALIKEAGYVKLDKDQTPPENPLTYCMSKVELTILKQTQQDMITAGWRKTE